MRKRVAGALLAGLVFGSVSGLASVPQPAKAQQFSAQIISTASGTASSSTAKLYVADRKVRIETPELPGDVLIVDAAIPAAYLVRPAQRIFMDSKQSSRLTRLFVPLDPAAPCRQWQAMAEVAGISDSGQWRCVATGSEIVDGRNTRKFAVTSLRGRSTRWIDVSLKFPLKIETEDGAVLALDAINEAPQPPERFKIPADYKKFDPRAVIEQMKRSDIWVEPPVDPGAHLSR
jgi:hypothetical protein